MKELFNFKIIEDDIEKNYDILYLFENNNIKYVVYTDNKYNKGNKLNILASKYEFIDDQIKLISIESEEEFDLIDKLIEKELED